MSNLVYAWTNNKSLSENGTKAFIEYVEKNQAYLISIGNFVFDSLSLSDKTMLSKCLTCEKYQSENCCHGNSYSMPKEQVDKLNENMEDILRVMPDGAKRLESFYNYGAFTRGNATSTKGAPDGGCVFSYKDSDGHSLCAIHAWCLESGNNPNEFKPYPCSLFPLTGIIMPNEKIFLFNSNRDTQNFSMYFYTLLRRICVNEEAMMRVYSGKGENKYLRSVNSDRVMSDNLSSYFRPVYIEQEGILRYLCGNDVYDKLCLEMKDRS